MHMCHLGGGVCVLCVCVRVCVRVCVCVCVEGVVVQAKAVIGREGSVRKSEVDSCVCPLACVRLYIHPVTSIRSARPDLIDS